MAGPAHCKMGTGGVPPEEVLNKMSSMFCLVSSSTIKLRHSFFWFYHMVITNARRQGQISKCLKAPVLCYGSAILLPVFTTSPHLGISKRPCRLRCCAKASVTLPNPSTLGEPKQMWYIRACLEATSRIRPCRPTPCPIPLQRGNGMMSGECCSAGNTFRKNATIDPCCWRVWKDREVLALDNIKFENHCWGNIYKGYLAW